VLGSRHRRPTRRSLLDNLNEKDLRLIAEYRTLCPQLADRCEALEAALDIAIGKLNEIDADPSSYAFSAGQALDEINKLTNQ